MPTNKAWFQNRLKDHYLLKSRVDDFRSRAAYKLEELDQKYKLIKQGAKILDLGAAPGSWSQYALRKTNGKAKIIAIDLLDIENNLTTKEKGCFYLEDILLLFYSLDRFL